MWTVPPPFEWPEDAGDPNTTWQTHPEDPVIQHVSRSPRGVVRVTFPPGDSFRVFGLIRDGDPPTCRVIDRAGRFHLAGPAALGWVLSRIIDRELTGVPPRTCPSNPPPGEPK